MALSFFSFFCLSFTVEPCGTLDYFKQSQQDLDVKIQAFNFEFESKTFARTTRFVHPNFLKDFRQKSLEVYKNTTFLENTTLDLKLFKDDQPIPLTSSDSAEDFNRDEVTIRYQVSILPSIKLKDTWVVIPKIDSFLK
jgi:hypothetical protein